MAKVKVDIDALCNEIIEDVKKKLFRPVYLLMGTETYYIDKVCDAIVEHALEDYERDFNQLICYGADVDAGTVIDYALRYPMMADRQLVVVREAQAMRDYEDLASYCEKPLDSTILVICMKGKSADKRKALYKNVVKHGQVFESDKLRDNEMAPWIINYFRKQNIDIDPDAAALLAEYVGTDMGKINIETVKMLKNLPVGTTHITIEDVETNVGISRQYSVFELTKELSYHNVSKALKVASYIGTAHGFAMPMATSVLYMHFYRLLKYAALLAQNPNPDREQKARALKGVNPYFYREYDQAVRFYPLKKCMYIIALIKEYDYRGKGGDGGLMKQDELLMELIGRILSC